MKRRTFMGCLAAVAMWRPSPARLEVYESGTWDRMLTPDEIEFLHSRGERGTDPGPPTDCYPVDASNMTFWDRNGRNVMFAIPR